MESNSPFWTYKKYTRERIDEVDRWLKGPVHKEVILSDNLWDNMEKLASKLEVHLHPAFAHREKYIKMASKDLELKKLAEEHSNADNVSRGRPVKEERELSNNQYLRRLTYLIISNMKMDIITLKMMAYCINSSKIDTIKLSSVQLTNEEFQVLAEYLKDPACKIRRLFYDWNHNSDFTESQLAELGHCRKLDFLLVRGCRMNDKTFIKLMKNLQQTDVQLKVLDLYANNLTNKSVYFLSEFIKEYRHVESFGFGGNKLSSLKPWNDFFIQCGKLEINQQEYDRLTALHRNREKIVEKNNKLRTLKKPEEQVPYVDPIEHDTASNRFYQICYRNLKYINLVGNRMKIEVDELDYLVEFLQKMRDTVVILSVNRIGEMVEERLVEFNQQVLL